MAQAASAGSLPRAAAAKGDGYIAGPVADWVFLIASPLLAILLFVPFLWVPALRFAFPEATEGAPTFGRSIQHGFIMTVVYAHLVLVFVRSHLNRDIFALHPGRFIVAPIALMAALLVSDWAVLLVGILAIWWDVYHSCMQTFGIGRIYDMRAGNGPLVGRRLDSVWNILFYAGPIVAGASLVGHLTVGPSHNLVQSAFIAQAPAYADSIASMFLWLVIGFGIPFTFYYVYRYWQLAREGYRVSFQKVALYVTLGIVSVACWGFNSFGEAFFVMNFFHALQYFFIVWHMEGDNVTGRLGLAQASYGRPIALAVFIGLPICFGLWSTGIWTLLELPSRAFLSLLLVVSIMHFWYDGFIWSVRRAQVT